MYYFQLFLRNSADFKAFRRHIGSNILYFQTFIADSKSVTPKNPQGATLKSILFEANSADIKVFRRHIGAAILNF